MAARAMAFAAIYLFWGATYFSVAIGLRSIPPLLLMTGRSLFGGAILLGVAWARGKVSGANWKSAASSGVLLFLGCHGVLAVAQKSAPSGFAAVVLATIPFWLVLLNRVFPGQKKPSGKVLLSLLPGFAGVSLVAWKQMTSGEPGHQVSWAPIALLAFAALSWAAGTAIATRYAGKEDKLGFAAMELLSGALALAVVSLCVGERVDPAKVTAASWMALAFLVIAGTVLGFGAYIWLLQQVPAPVVASYTFVNPVIAVVLGWAFLGEKLSAMFLAGMGLVIVSVIGLWWEQKRETA
jgi:drug/metabolite transporter (DMT)-like permease